MPATRTSATTSKSKKKSRPTRSAQSTQTGRGSRRRPVQPDDLLRYQILSDPQISPDGRQIVFCHKKVGEKNEYATNLWTVSADGGDARAFTTGNRDRSPRWSPDGRQIAFIRRAEKHLPQIWLIPASGGEARQLTNVPEGTIASFKWSPDGTTLAVKYRETDPQWTKDATKQRKASGLSTPARVIDDWWYRLDGDGYFDAQRFHVYIVDAASGDHRRLYDEDTLGEASFDFSPDSKELIVATNRDPQAMIRPWKSELLRINVQSGKVRVLKGLPEGVKTEVKWSPDGTAIAWAGRTDKDSVYSTENLLVFVADADGSNARPLTDSTDYCLMAVNATDTAEMTFGPKIEWSRDSQRISMQIGWHGEAHIASVPRGGGRMTFHTDGEVVCQMGSVADDGKSMALTVGAATKLDEIHIARTTSKAFAIRQLTDLNGPLLSELDLASPQSHWVDSTNGVQVQVWSLKPVGAKGKGTSPAVLEIHGGPHAQYGVGYFHEFQVLAGAGYAVFYSNPRGSKGYGRDFCAAIRGSWGMKDWEDIQAVTQFMQQRKHVDTKRMGVMGGSYGGYMTNWVIGHTDVFAGAITDRCVSNLVSMFGTSDHVDVPDRYWVGAPWDRPESLWAHSPLKYLGNARTPTLIIHSEGDLRCNVSQSEEVFVALKSNDVPCRFVRYPSSTSHGMSRGGPPDLRLHRLGQILDWWQTWLRT